MRRTSTLDVDHVNQLKLQTIVTVNKVHSTNFFDTDHPANHTAKSYVSLSFGRVLQLRKEMTIKYIHVIIVLYFQMDAYAPFLYDTMITWAECVNYTLQHGGNPRDGALIYKMVPKAAKTGT